MEKIPTLEKENKSGQRTYGQYQEYLAALGRSLREGEMKEIKDQLEAGTITDEVASERMREVAAKLRSAIEGEE